jgi:SAM-dependent methyltransferase
MTLQDDRGIVGSKATLERIYPEVAFGGYTNFDGTLRFYSRVQAILAGTSRDTVLNFGCGRGAHAALVTETVRGAMTFRGRARRVIGVDVDPVGVNNSDLDEFRLMSGTRIPMDDASVDLCVSDWVVEHLPSPRTFLAECARVIRPGGYLCFRTPNRFHYSSLGASMIPARHHHTVRRLLGHFHDAEDVFPTYYRCNTRARCDRELRRSGFESMVYLHHGESHLSGRGLLPGRLGRWIEALSPSMLHHEIHAFGRRASAAAE